MELNTSTEPIQSRKHGCLGSFKGLTMYELDLLTLEPCQWINGSIIQFKNLLLENELSFSQGDCKIRIMDPLVSALIVYCSEEEVTDTVEMTGIEYFDLVLLPINDNTDPLKKYQGQHWTFLMLFKQENTLKAFHCCSLGKPMPQSGHLIVERIATYLKLEKEVVDLSLSRRQKNSFDCGLFTLFYEELAVIMITQNGCDNVDEFIQNFLALEKSHLMDFDPAKKRKELSKSIKMNVK